MIKEYEHADIIHFINFIDDDKSYPSSISDFVNMYIFGQLLLEIKPRKNLSSRKAILSYISISLKNSKKWLKFFFYLRKKRLFLKR